MNADNIYIIKPKMTPEEAKKQMEETTRIELAKLNEAIKNNPNILRPKYHDDSDSDSDSSYSEDSYEDSAASSSSESSSDSEKGDNLELFKKDLRIDKLEQKNYYKSLEMSNLMLENDKLKEEILKIKIEYNDTLKFMNVIKDVIKLKNLNIEPVKIPENPSIEFLSEQLLKNQKEFDSFKNKIKSLEESLNSLESFVRIYFIEEIKKNKVHNETIFNENITRIKSNLKKLANDYDYVLFQFMIGAFVTYQILKYFIPN